MFLKHLQVNRYCNKFTLTVHYSAIECKSQVCHDAAAPMMLLSHPSSTLTCGLISEINIPLSYLKNADILLFCYRSKHFM